MALSPCSVGGMSHGFASGPEPLRLHPQVATRGALEQPADRPAEHAALIDRQVDLRASAAEWGEAVVGSRVGADRVVRPLPRTLWIDLDDGPGNTRESRLFDHRGTTRSPDVSVASSAPVT